jgi:hypothetical protein
MVAIGVATTAAASNAIEMLCMNTLVGGGALFRPPPAFRLYQPKETLKKLVAPRTPRYFQA